MKESGAKLVYPFKDRWEKLPKEIALISGDNYKMIFSLSANIGVPIYGGPALDYVNDNDKNHI